MILFFHFKFIASKIGDPQTETSSEIDVDSIVADIQIAVARGVKYSFFNSKCYDQALATTFMLKRRGISSTIYFGLNKAVNFYHKKGFLETKRFTFCVIKIIVYYFKSILIQIANTQIAYAHMTILFNNVAIKRFYL